MPKSSLERTNARKEEIVTACARLYETMSFKEITIKEIARFTSFTRPSIYNYFQTKEEIFLALLGREYDLWTADLQQLHDSHDAMTVDEFSSALAHTLEKRERMLKLMSMNHYDMETSSRMENLIEFKKSYGASMRMVRSCVEKFSPQKSEQEVQRFIYSFFPFLFGVYPYTVVSEKQREAMEQAYADYVFFSLYELTYSCIHRLLEGF